MVFLFCTHVHVLYLITGLHSLVEPSCEEELVVNILSGCLNQHSNNGNPISENNFQDCTHKFLQCVKALCSQSKGTYHTTAIWVPCLRSLLVVVSETLFVSCSSQICKKAVEDVVVVPCTVKLQLTELLVRLIDIQKRVLYLQNEMCQVLDFTSSQDFNHDSSMTVVRQSQYVLDMLEGCQSMLAVVVDVVEKKASFDVRFFNTASVTAGLFSAGRIYD